MARSALIGARITCVLLLLALAGQALQPQRTFAANEFISVSPNTGAVGSIFTVTGSGFTTSTVQVYFGGVLLGSANVSGGSLMNATFSVPNVPANTYVVQVQTPTGAGAGVSQSAFFTVTGGGPTPSLANLNLSKLVRTTAGFLSCANGAGCTVPNQAGATITYAIQYQNTANAPIGQITITDALGSSQALVSASPGCSLSGTTVTCVVNNIPAAGLSGSTNSVTITTQPVTGFTGVLTNQACATEAGFVGQVCTNTTYVGVNTGTIAGTTQICGAVTGYTPPSVFTNTYGTVVIAGQTITIAPGAAITGSAITTTGGLNNFCITFTFQNNVATALSVASNLATANVVCGVLTFTPGASTVVVGGVTYSTAVSMTGIVAGQQVCFLLQNGVIVGILSGIPTAVQLPSHQGIRHTQARAE